MNNLKRMLDNSYSHYFLTIVTSVHHQGTHKTFDNGTLCFTETFHIVTTGSVREIDGTALVHGDIVLKTEIVDADVLE